MRRPEEEQITDTDQGKAPANDSRNDTKSKENSYYSNTSTGKKKKN